MKILEYIFTFIVSFITLCYILVNIPLIVILGIILYLVDAIKELIDNKKGKTNERS